MEYISRQIEKTLLDLTLQFPAVAVCGPRQTGKSTLLKKILGSRYTYATFDDPVLRERAKTDPRLFLSELGSRVILDEIQYVPEILSYLKIAIDNQRQKNGQFILTGSQQFQLIKNLGDSLAGRIALLNLLPFNRKEIVSARKTKSLSHKASFLNACLTGSYPEPVVKIKINVDEWYSGYIQTYLERDVRGTYGVGSLLDFQRFLRLLAGRCSQILNLSGFANELGVAVSTIKNWLSILVAGQIVFLLPPYFNNFGKRVVKNPKVYFSDCGLATYLTGLRTKDAILYGPLAGPLFENYVVQETLKTFYAAGRRPDIYYYRTHKGLEIDLAIHANGKITPFEIKMTKSPGPGMAQNILKAAALSNDFDLQKAGLITLGDESYKLSKNIKIYSLSDFLEQIIV